MEQSTGTYIAVSRYASATPIPPSVLSRGIGWQVKNKKHTIKLKKTQNLSLLDLPKCLNANVVLCFKGFGILLCGFFGAGNATSISV